MVNHILLINLLIAILSSTYALYEQQGVSLYVNGILQMRSAAEYDHKYGALVSTFPPFNIVLLPFIPFYMLKENTKKLNHLVFHLTYVPILLISFLLFFVFNMICIPFAYFKCVGSRFYQLSVHSPSMNLCKKYAQLVLFIVFGIPILLLNFCFDCYLFFEHSYQKDITHRMEKEIPVELQAETYNLLKSAIH